MWIYFSITTTTMVVGAPSVLPDTKGSLRNGQDYFRDKRSQYGTYYTSPCGGASSAPIPTYPSAGYHGQAPAQAGYGTNYVYGGPHYRLADPAEFDPEMLGYSDMDQYMQHMQHMHQMPMARHENYEAPIIHNSMSAPTAASPATAFGVFPNVNVGGCSVPLLFSCTPSVVQGKILNAQPQHENQGNSYRIVEPSSEVSEDENENVSAQATSKVTKPNPS